MPSSRPIWWWQINIFVYQKRNSDGSDHGCQVSAPIKLAALPAFATSMLLLSWTVFKTVDCRRKKSKSNLRQTPRAIHVVIYVLGIGWPLVIVVLSTLFRPAAYAKVHGYGCEPVVYLCEYLRHCCLCDDCLG